MWATIVEPPPPFSRRSMMRASTLSLEHFNVIVDALPASPTVPTGQGISVNAFSKRWRLLRHAHQSQTLYPTTLLASTASPPVRHEQSRSAAAASHRSIEL